MNQNLIYRGPEASHATRPIARRCKGSLRGSMVAALPGFPRPRIIQFESALEYAFLCLMLERDDVYHIQEQPPAVAFSGADGRPAHHIFDFLITLTSGERIAVAIKPMSRVLHLNFVSRRDPTYWMRRCAFRPAISRRALFRLTCQAETISFALQRGVFALIGHQDDPPLSP